MSVIQNPVQVITRHMVTPASEIAIDYPYVLGIPNGFVQQKINNTILMLVNSLMEEQIQRLVAQGYAYPIKATMQGWYEIKTNERGILSLSVGNYTYPYPAAHGLTIIRSLTFDVNTGRLYKLKDLFKQGSNYVKAISIIIQEQIKMRNISTLNGFSEINPDQDYYIADKALVVYFQLYEITPYVYGFPFFPISVYELDDIIDENGPLGKMIINT